MSLDAIGRAIGSANLRKGKIVWLEPERAACLHAREDYNPRSAAVNTAGGAEGGYALRAGEWTCLEQG